MKKFIIIDSSNLFNRAKFVTSGNIDTKIGMSLHIMFNSIKKMWNNFNGDHIIFAFEGRSWRRKYYEPYKANRDDKKSQMTPKESEEDVLFWEAFEEMKNFIIEHTNCTVLQHAELEADDLIAGFITAHPDDEHIIISTDSDFHQLLSSNVKQYNGVAEKLYTIEGIFDKDGNLDTKSEPIDPEWELFLKCIKGTKNKVGLIDAFNDRHDQGWEWNNIMNAKWIDHKQNEHIVEIDYNRNRVLIDLNAQPDDIKIKIFETILNETNTAKDIRQVGIKFMKFCGLYNLKEIANYATYYAEAFQTRYPYA